MVNAGTDKSATKWYSVPLIDRWPRSTTDRHGTITRSSQLQYPYGNNWTRQLDRNPYTDKCLTYKPPDLRLGSRSEPTIQRSELYLATAKTWSLYQQSTFNCRVQDKPPFLTLPLHWNRLSSFLQTVAIPGAPAVGYQLALCLLNSIVVGGQRSCRHEPTEPWNRNVYSTFPVNPIFGLLSIVDSLWGIVAGSGTPCWRLDFVVWETTQPPQPSPSRSNLLFW